jgi:glycosyltransferase involved in cell wall biosynthesis
VRLLWITHFLPYPPTGHGALQRTHQLLRAAAARHEVHLISVVPPGTSGDVAALEAALGGRLASAETVPLHPGPAQVLRAGLAAASLTGGASYWERWLWPSAASDAVRRVLARVPIELVHLDTIFLAQARPVLGDRPLVLTHHNVESELLERRASAAGGLRGAFFARQARRTLALERELAPHAAVNLVVSEEDGNRLRARVPAARVHVVPNGVDVDYFRPVAGMTPERGGTVFAGGMDWYPNRVAMQWTAASLWPVLAEADPARTLTVIGRHPPAELTALAARDPRVRVLGFVDDVRPHITRASAYLCPIHEGGGTRLKILDALAMQRPLVSTALGVDGLGLRDGGHYLRAEQPADFAAQLARLDQDPALAQRLASAGRTLVEDRFGWSVVGEALDAAYHVAVRAVTRLPITQPTTTPSAAALDA